MTPWELASSGTEHGHQRALFAWANWAARHGFFAASDPLSYQAGAVYSNDPVPQLHFMFAIHNRGYGDKIRGAIAKAEGVKAGVPDIFFPWPCFGFAGLFIELKKPKGRTSPAQDEWIAALVRVGLRGCCLLDMGGGSRRYPRLHEGKAS